MKKKMRNALELFVESPAEGDRLLHFDPFFKSLVEKLWLQFYLMYLAMAF